MSQEPAKPAPESTRLDRVYRRWQKTPESPRQAHWWRPPPLELAGRVGLGIALVSSFLLIPFSQAIVPLDFGGMLPKAVTLLPFEPVLLAALLPLFLLNAWLIDSFLAQRTPTEARLKPPARALRRLASSLPLLGFAVIPICRWLLERHPASLIGSAPIPCQLWLDEQHRSSLRILARRLTREPGLGALALLNTLLLGFLIIVSTTCEPKPFERLVVGAVGMGFHLAAFVAIAAYLASTAHRANAPAFNFWTYCLPPLFWLAPIPYFAVAGLACVGLNWFLIDERSWERTLVHKAFFDRGTLHLPDLSPPAPLEPNLQQENLAKLYRAKVAVLAFDASALGWLATKAAARWPAWEPTIIFGLAMLGILALGVCLLASGIVVTRFVDRARRRESRLAVLDRHPWAQFLALSQLSLLAGFEIGHALATDDPETIAGVLQFVGLVAGFAFLAAFLLEDFLPKGERVVKPWAGMFGFAGFFGLAVIGHSMSNPANARFVVATIEVFTISAPLLSLGLARAFRRWLLKAFAMRSKRWPSAVARFVWWFLNLTAALPFGGLFVPVWIYHLAASKNEQMATP